MAAPPEKTINDLTGKWVMNKTKSKDFDPILALQGIGWMTRTIIGKATVTVNIKQYTDDAGKHIDVDQVLTGGITSTPEKRILDWNERPHKDATFGDLVGRSKLTDSKNLEPGFGGEDVEFLSAGWDADEQLHSWVENKKAGWTATQVWGFQTVDGERRYVRKVVVRKGNELRQGFLVYDYAGPL